MIDIEKLTNKYLRQHTDVRVVAHPPEDRSTPWVMYTMYDAPQAPNSKHDHVVRYYMQFDCYAGAEGGLPEANELMRTVRAAIVVMPGTYDEGIVTAARIQGSQRLPDSAMEPARDRYILDAMLVAHGI